MIISVSGYAGSGKDTVGKIIQLLNCYNTGSITFEETIEDHVHHQWWIEAQSGWAIKKWAGKLKTIASLLTGIPVEKFEDQEFKKTNLGPEWNVLKMKPGKRQDGIFPKKVDMESVPMTIRDFLQKLGTDGLREGLHTNTWVNALMADYNCVPADRAPNGWDCSNWIITDTRFPNEANAVKNANGITIRVGRPGITAVNAHPSETALDHWMFDYTIINDGDISKLTKDVKQILLKEGLLQTEAHADHQTKN
jgi:hypothetical protein